MYKIISIGDVEKASWSELVRKSPVATWFQTEEAYTFYKSLSFFEPFALAVESDGQLKGVAVGYVQKEGGKFKGFFSKRAIILGGPLLSEDISDEGLEILLRELIDSLKEKAIFLETRNFNDYGRWRAVFEKCGFAYEPHYDVHVDTSSVEVINGRIDRNRKRNIKKAREKGVVVDENPTYEDLRSFYALLEILYRTKVKLPLYPFEFFEKLREVSSSRFFVAKKEDGEVIGGLVCVVLDGRAVYAWMACGEDQKYREMSPSVMVNYAGICHAAEQGCGRFDFMGAGKPDDGGYGVRDFKLKFGGELVEYGRFNYVCNPLLFNVGKLGVNLMKKL